MCEDYSVAKHNRRMVELKLNICEYVRIENLVRGWPKNKRLPDHLLGSLPTIGKHERLYGFHEVKE